MVLVILDLFNFAVFELFSTLLGHITRVLAERIIDKEDVLLAEYDEFLVAVELHHCDKVWGLTHELLESLDN